MGIDTPNRTRRIQLVEKKAPRPLAERGKIMYAEDVQELLGKGPSGKPRRSRTWILTNVAPNDRHKEGKAVYWWECDVLAWMDAQREGVA